MHCVLIACRCNGNCVWQLRTVAPPGEYYEACTTDTVSKHWAMWWKYNNMDIRLSIKSLHVQLLLSYVMTLVKFWSETMALAVMSCSWEGNPTLGDTLATCCVVQWSNYTCAHWPKKMRRAFWLEEYRIRFFFTRLIKSHSHVVSHPMFNFLQLFWVYWQLFLCSRDEASGGGGVWGFEIKTTRPYTGQKLRCPSSNPTP